MYSGEYNACDVTLSMHTDCNDAKYFYIDKHGFILSGMLIKTLYSCFLTVLNMANRTVFLTK
jgi:hypothetical protein